jgi:cysteate synthase
MLICLRRATYPDAIRLVGRIQERFDDALVREGGAYNVARRDAMGVPVLRAVHEIGRIPDHYVQAVGSGTGGIAAHEAVLRLTASKAFTQGTMRLHLVQNTPFTPLVDAWKRGAREVEPMSPEEIYRRLQQTYSNVLANADPPYGVAGGVRDTLEEAGGDMVAVSNDEAREASERIERHLDLVPYPEAGVAFAGLVKQRNKGHIGRDDLVLLHATGGGEDRSCTDLGKERYPVGLTIGPEDVDEACAAVEVYLGRLPGSAR